MDINEEAYAIQEEVVEFRRALHRCPEIAFHETMTMEYLSLIHISEPTRP